MTTIVLNGSGSGVMRMFYAHAPPDIGWENEVRPSKAEGNL